MGPGAQPPAAQRVDCGTDAGPVHDVSLVDEQVIDGVVVARTDGRTAAARAREDGRPVVLFDLVANDGAARVGFACSDGVPDAVIEGLVAGLAARGIAATRLPDWPGLVVMRTVAMLANEAYEAMLQGVADADGIDDAMRFGVNYPRGPVDWANDIGPRLVLSVLDSIHELTGDPRYRASLALRLAADAA